MTASKLRLRMGAALGLLGALCLIGAACSNPSSSAGGAHPRTIAAVGAESEYANVISQVGGSYVEASTILSNPNTDPHSFEASPSVAREVSQAQLLVENGAGYDTWMDTIEKAAPDPARRVIKVQALLGLPDSAANPHLWYDPKTMPAVAKRIATDLSALDPSRAAYFHDREVTFENSLQPWLAAIASFKATYPNTPVAVTEPVGDYLLQAAGADVVTPFQFQADIMNGVDPAPQDVAAENALFSQRRVRMFLYNQQVTDSLTQTFLAAAHSAGIPVVGVYETMPTGYTYQSWMLAEVQAMTKAMATGASTAKL